MQLLVTFQFKMTMDRLQSYAENSISRKKKGLSVAAHIYNLSMGKMEDKWIHAAHWPVSLAESELQIKLETISKNKVRA